MVKIIRKHWSIFSKICFLVFFFVVIIFSSKFFYSNPLPAKGSWLATSTWIGGVTGNWQNAANWSNGIPISTMLADISSSTSVTITATGTIDFDTLRVGGGTASSTLILVGNIGAGIDIDIKNNGKITQSSTVQQTISGTMLIESGGTLNHSTNTIAQARVINFNANTITLNSGGFISASGTGYAGGATSNGAGQGPGGGASAANNTGAGGAHGGNGGDNTTSVGGQGYCDVTSLNTIGSGGAGSQSAAGGAGGGLIILTATGTITLNGAISANGNSAGNTSAGAGAGGAIKITADIISGTPTSFTAIGGSGAGGGSTGAGGGGCVDLFYTTSNTITPTSSYFFINGGAGTVSGVVGNRGSGGIALVKQTGVNNGGLYLLNSGSATAVTQPSSTVSAITADFIYVSSTIFQVTSSKTFTLVNSDPFFGNGLGEIRVYGSMVKSAGVFDNVHDTVLTIESGASVTVSSTFTASSSLNLYKGFGGIATDTFTNLIIQSGTTTVYNYTASASVVLSSLTINGGFLTHGDNSTAQTSVLNISATGNITVNSGGTVIVTGVGYDGGNSSAGEGPGGGTDTIYAGGGHGGDGGGGTDGTLGGRGYCDITNVSTIGSGGGQASVSGNRSSGAGLIILSATGTITINGAINANGIAGAGAAGGGAGGGIKITANIISGTPTSFTATGGTGGSATTGGGGGGCVDLFYTTSNTIIPTSTYFSIGGGNPSSGTRGGGGMALVKQSSANGGLYLLNSGSATAITQPSSTVPAITADFIYVSSSIFQVTSSKTFTLVNSDPFSGNGLGEIRVYGILFKSAGFNSIHDIALTVESGASVSVSSTFTASSSLNLYRGFIGIAANTFTNLIIQSGTTTVYDFNITTVPLSLTTLTMNSSSALTAATNTAAQSNILYVVASSTITINAGATVLVNAGGYASGGTTATGSGPGGGGAPTTSAKGGGGGAHGGNGGAGSFNSGIGGTAYCSSTNPTTIGSGGGGGSAVGGTGAGLIILSTVSSTITINGSIKANGNNGVGNTGGGGAGGGIKLIATAIAGTPQSFTANGGNGLTTGGGGGGGCIYIQYITSNSVTSTVATSTGGTSGTGTAGSAGTFQITQINNVPTVVNIFPRQTSVGIVTVTTTISDADLNTTTLSVFYSTDGITWVSSTIANVTEGGVGDGVATATPTGIITGIDTNVNGTINLTFEWNVGANLANTEDASVYIKITPNDGVGNGTVVSSTAFAIDTKAPTAPGNLVLFNTSTQLATLTFGSASVEGNFLQYIIYYKTGSSVVAITDSAFTSSSNLNLGFINYNTATSTTVSGLATSTQYVMNIWAYDGFSNTPAASEITFYTLANTPSAPTLSGQTTTTLNIAITSGDTNPATVEYAIQETSSTNYLQTDGTFGASAAWATKSSWGTKTVIGLSANTAYTFKVKARNGNNVETAFSATSSVTSLANNVTTLVATNSTITSTYRMDLSWTNSGQTGMKLERDNACDGSYDVTLYDNVSVNESSPTTTLSSLLANTCYRFRISSYNTAGTLNSTNVAVSNDITMPPAAPTNLTASTITTSTITWSWDAVTGATTYYVYNTNSVLIDTVSVTSSVQTGLTVSTSYSVFVRAANSNGTGVSSSIATAITGPLAPTGLQAASRTISTITWNWTNDGQYQFYAQDKNNNSNNSGWVATTTWLQSGLTANTAYTLQVKARDVGSIESGFTEITRYTSQNFPTGITFITTTASSITLAINGSFINLGSGSSLIHIDNGVGVTQDLTSTSTWQNTGLNAGAQYTYTTYAVNGDGLLTASTTGSKYTLAATPSAPTVFGPSVSTLSITVTAGDSNSAGVEYAILETGSGNYVQSNGSLGASAFWASTSTWGNKTVTGLSVNTQYIFKVKARNGENTETSFGSTASLYTFANVPGAPSLGNAATSSLSVTINTNNNPTYTTYSIYNNTASNYGAANGSPTSSPVWQTTSTWGSNYFATGLSPNTSYNFSVIARNGDNAPTATSTSSSAKYTLASIPSSVLATADSKTQITLTWVGDATTSYAENVTAGTNSGWISGTSYVFIYLTCATPYSFRVKAINAEGIETSFSSSVTAQTAACNAASAGGGTAFPVTVSPPVVVPPIPPVEPEPEIPPVITTTTVIIPPKVLPPKQIPAIVVATGTIKTITKNVTTTLEQIVFLPVRIIIGKVVNGPQQIIFLPVRTAVNNVFNGPQQIAFLPVRIVVGTVVNGPQQVVISPAPTSVVVVPEEQLVATTTPISLRGEWAYIDPAMLNRFVFAPLPKDFLAIGIKFPKIQNVLSQIGVNRFSDIEKLKSTNIYLPGLNNTMGLNQATLPVNQLGVVAAIPLDKISILLKNKIPANIIFAQTAGRLVDLKTSLSVNEKSHPEQTINTISGKPLGLTIKPDHPVSRVRGYLLYIPKVTQVNPAPTIAFSAKNLLFGQPAVASTGQAPTEKELVLLEFEYTDPDKDGIYTANIEAPVPAGQYKILTIMDYEDPNLGSRSVELIAVVDPEGRVYEKVSNRQLIVSGATVTIFYLNPDTQKYEFWRAKDFLQSNPLITDAKGVYSFLVPEGKYYLKVEAPGYLVYEGQPFTVEQGGGIHTDIELKPKYWGLKILDWRTIAVLMLAVFLGYFVYKEKKLEKKEKVLEDLLEKR